MKQAQFRFHTGLLKAVKDDDGTRYIVGIASSTAIDRDNDRMSKNALHTMKATAEANLTIFTNHEYRVPDDLFGSCVEARIKAKTDEEQIVVKAEDGDEIIDTFDPQTLEIKIKVVSDEVNPKAGQIFRAIEEGVNLGMSIGGVVDKVKKVVDATTEKTYNLIESINLYEVSIVSIPANPDAMGLAISKALKGVKVDKANKEEINDIVKHAEKKDEIPSLEKTVGDLRTILKYYLDEDYYISDEDKAQMKKERREYAKARAENVLLMAGESVQTKDSDDDVIHLSEHSYEFEKMLRMEMDTTEMAKHVKKHMKKLKGILKNDKQG